MSNDLSVCNNRPRRSIFGQNFDIVYSRTFLFQDSYFNGIVHLRNSLLDENKCCPSLLLLKIFKDLYILMLHIVLYPYNNICNNKLVCPKCRRVNPVSVCS